MSITHKREEPKWIVFATSIDKRPPLGVSLCISGSAIVDNGSPLGKTKRISAEGIADIKSELTAYTVVQTESHEAAAQLFEGHPHFTVFPGDAIEVMECIPMPGT